MITAAEAHEQAMETSESTLLAHCMNKIQEAVNLGGFSTVVDAENWECTDVIGNVRSKLCELGYTTLELMPGDRFEIQW